MENLEWEMYARSILYAFIFVTGIIGNVFVMFFFGFKMKRAANFRWFVIHLAIADCTYAIVSPIQLIYLMISGTWELGTFLCKISFIGPITVNVSAFLLCFMAYERYRAICHPFRERLSKRLINSVALGIWIVCIILKAPVIYRMQVFDGQCIMLTEGDFEHIAIAVSFLVFESILPLTLLMIFFVRIKHALQDHESFRETIGIQRTTTDTNETNTDNCQLTQVQSPERDVEGSTGKISNDGVHFTLRRGIFYSSQSESPMIMSQKENSNTIESDESPLQSIDLPLISENQNNDSADSTNKKQTIRKKYTSLKTFVKQHTHANSDRPQTLFGLKDKRDRATISVLFLSVALFALTSLPYNIYYFVTTFIFLYLDWDSIYKYTEGISVANQWLAVLFLFGSIMNVIVYSGKFPRFRQQAYMWVTRSCSKKQNFPRSLTFSTTYRHSVCNNSTYMASTHYEKKRRTTNVETVTSSSEHLPKISLSTSSSPTFCTDKAPRPRSQNDYVKV